MDYVKESTLLAEQSGQLEVVLKWDMKSGKSVDFDVSAVCFSAEGTLVDAAYYNQLVAVKGAVVHTGDCRRGGKKGNDERIKLDLARMTNISVVVFLLSAYSGDDLGSCAKAACDVFNNGALVTTMTSTSTESGSEASLILFSLFRHPYTAKWHFVEVRKPVTGRHFSACLVSIRQIVDRVLGPTRPLDRTFTADKTFAMEKGDVLEIPSSIQRLYVGLGWTAKGDGIDLDASCIMLAKSHGGLLTPVDMAYFQNQVRPGVQHLGDNTTGEGDGDDERILIDLALVEDHVAALAIVVTIFNPRRSFQDITDSYVRLLDAATGHVYARFALHEQLNKTAVVFCMLTCGSTPAEPWTLLTVGEEVAARTGRMLKSYLWEGYFAAPGQRLTTTPAEPMVDPAAPAPFDALPASPAPPSPAIPKPVPIAPPTPPVAESADPPAQQGDSECCLAPPSVRPTSGTMEDMRNQIERA